MNLVFDDRAVADLEAIYHWIAQDSPAAAKSVVERLFGSIELLIHFPSSGALVTFLGRLNGSCRVCPISSCTKLTEWENA